MTTPAGMTLYTFDKDAAGKSNCEGQCAPYWHPLLASQGSTATANMTLVERSDGQIQWATANGMPLYTYADDESPGDEKGNNFHNRWRVAMW
jgi:predicted lipoprotein with Yx(FWY)xxD motif